MKGTHYNITWVGWASAEDVRLEEVEFGAQRVLNDHARDCSRAWGELASTLPAGSGLWPHLDPRMDSAARKLESYSAALDIEDFVRWTNMFGWEYLGGYFPTLGLARLTRGARSEALRLQDMYDRLGPPPDDPKGGFWNAFRARSAAVRAFALNGNDLTCGIPLPVPPVPSSADPTPTRPDPVPAWVRPVGVADGDRPEVSRFVAAARSALSGYAAACSLGTLWYDVGYSHCPITELHIDDGGTHAALAAASDLAGPLLAGPDVPPEVRWWAALLAANRHDVAGSVSLLDELARTSSIASDARGATAARDWIVAAGGLDCHLPFVAGTPGSTAP